MIKDQEYERDNRALDSRLVNIDDLRTVIEILILESLLDDSDSFRESDCRAVFIEHDVLRDFNKLRKTTRFEALKNRHLKYQTTYDIR